MNAHLTDLGMDPTLDSTPINGFRSRSDEILDWVKRHPSVRHFVALDDMDLEYPHGAAFGKHFVQTDSMNGLVDADVERALQILKLNADTNTLPSPELQEETKW